MTRRTTLALAALLVLGPLTARADDAMTEGEVRKLDPDTGRITLKHGEIRNLDMPAMTMVFHVKDKALLSRVKVGDRVRFRAAHTAGQYLVTELQVQP